MAIVTFITGGQRSGKSSFAQKLAEERSGKPVYLATSRIWDEDFKARVDRHRKDRGEQWQTLEEQIELSKHDFSGKTVVLDCITLWLTNIYFDNNNDIDKCLEIAKREWGRLVEGNFDLIVISNELGMGVHPENELARKFADLQGWMNQHIAQSADTVYLMVSGIPAKLKPE